MQAVEYFSEKLAQYGEGTEVPIRSLLGHRSQASPEVRHVSGQHFHEFRDFLLKYPNSYLVNTENETVILKNFSSIKTTTQELHFNPVINIDPEVTQTLLDFLAECIVVKGPILVEQLFQIVSCNLPENMWSNLFNTPAHLTSFLRLFNDSFHIQANLITLIQNPKVNQKHINAQILSQQSLDINSNTKSDTQELRPEPNFVGNLDEDKKFVRQVKAEQSSISPESDNETKSLDKVQLSPRSSISDRLKQPRLQQKLFEARNKSPEPVVNLVPEAEKSKGVSFRLERYGKQPPEETNDRQKSTANQSLKQRINSLVLKTLQENTGRERQNLLNQNQNCTSDSWKVRLFQNTRVVCSVRECQVIVEEIMNRSNQKVKFDVELWPFVAGKTIIGFDCEGINLGLKGQLTLMQIATGSGCIYIFDLISCPEMIDAGLRNLLESHDVIKVSFSSKFIILFSFSLFRLFTTVATIPLISIVNII